MNDTQIKRLEEKIEKLKAKQNAIKLKQREAERKTREKRLKSIGEIIEKKLRIHTPAHAEALCLFITDESRYSDFVKFMDSLENKNG